MGSKGTTTQDVQSTDAEQRQNLLGQLAIQRRNLMNGLELQRSRYGIRVPLDLVNEIGLVQERIEEIEQELAQWETGEPGQAADREKTERAGRMGIDSGGGAVIFGDVCVGRDFVGRDQRTVIGGQEDADDE